MSNPYIVSKDSVITSLFVPSSRQFLTCGGTNIAPKELAPTWVDFNAETENFKYIFNSASFSSISPYPIVTGYPSGATAPTTIKQFLYDGANIEYVCGQFSLTTPDRTNIMYFDPLDTNVTKDADFKSLDVTFNPVQIPSVTTVNCMAPSLTGSYAKIFIAGKFATAEAPTIPPTVVSSIGQNIALLNVPGWTIDTTFNTTGTLIDDNATTINSMVVYKGILYVGGTNNGNCLFYSYNGSWKNLLGVVTLYPGTINVLEIISDKNQIAIGGKFTSLKTATNCNNIVRYSILLNSWIALGTGVTGIGADPIYLAPEVFALTYFSTTPGTLWVGGYFLNAGPAVRNSIAAYNISKSTWSSVKRNGSTVVGLLRDTDLSTDPGVIYTFYKAEIDTSNIVVGGSFRITSSQTNNILYNLIKITTLTPSSNNSTEYNITSI